MTPALNVLFLCTRNSAWSIMAEATLNRFADDKFRAYSVGKLRTVGYDVSGLHSNPGICSRVPIPRSSIS